MANVRPGIALLLLTMAIMLACSSDDNPIAPKPPDIPVVLDTGGLAQIPGDPSDTAFQVLPTVPSHPAPKDKMDDDGFMRTRLDAKLHPQATVQQLNDALALEQAVVTFANPGSLTLVLRVPEMSTRAEADSAATRLMATGAFLAVFPAYAAGLDGVAFAPGTAAESWEYLTRIKMPAAWNARGLAERRAEPVTVMVADKFASSTRHSDIPSQTFFTTSTGSYEDAPLSSGMVPGNHGFHVSGILAASLDDDQGTGAHPGNTTLIDLQCLTVGGLLFPEIVQNIRNHFPTTGRFVLNTSLGVNQSIATMSKLQRAYAAIDWRVAAAPHQDRFLHCTSAGNRGAETDDTRFSNWNSPFTMAAHFATPQEMAPLGDHTVIEVANLVLYAQQQYATAPQAQNPLTNVIIVGNSEYSGAKAPSSCAPSDVRTIGEEVPNVCAKADVSLDPNDCSLVAGELMAKYSGTSMATPQVAGLAAYLWNLKPELTVSELISTITSNYRETDPVIPGRVDAYQCVTSLDHSLADCPVRRELLDVAGATATAGSNQIFDENDLELYFTQYEAIRIAHDNNTGPLYDNSRYDLNGNGISTVHDLLVDYEPQRFDLDVNSPAYYAPEVSQTIEGQNIKYDETELSDLDILCYYAYSPLYTGDSRRRTELCLPCLGELVVHVLLPEQLRVGVSGNMEIRLYRKTSPSDSFAVSGATISCSATGGEVSPANGTTDEDGRFSAAVVADGSTEVCEVMVNAKLNDVDVAEGSAAADVEAIPMSRVELTKFYARLRSYACTFYGSDCFELKEYTAWGPENSSDAASWNDSYSLDGYSGVAANACSRENGVTVSEDGSLMTITYDVTSTSSAEATSPTGGGSMSAMGASSAQFEYLFSITGGTTYTDMTLQFSHDGYAEGYFYFLQLFRVGYPQPVVEFSFNPPDPIVENQQLSAELSIGDYRLVLYIESAASAITAASGGSESESAVMTAHGIITVGAAPVAP